MCIHKIKNKKIQWTFISRGTNESVIVSSPLSRDVPWFCVCITLSCIYTFYVSVGLNLSELKLRQIEFNTIAASLAGIAQRLTHYHRYLLGSWLGDLGC